MDTALNVKVLEDQGVYKGLLVRVFLGDGRERVVKMKDHKPTAGQVVQAIADKEGLSTKAAKLFGLFIIYFLFIKPFKLLRH